MTRLFLFVLGWFPLAAQPLESHFHHLHLNSTDPAAASAFYPARFDCEKARFDTLDAVRTQKSWLLFNQVSQPPPHDILSAIWHFGWGAEDMPAAYQQQLALGTKFSWPITELFPKFFYAYVEGPDKAIIELNTANHHHFGHLHLLSADPVLAGEWYVANLGATWRSGRPPTREPRFLRGFQVGPSASLMMDNVNIIIFPIEYARQQWPEIWKDRAEFVSSKGRVVDHVAFSVPSLEQAAARFPALSKPAAIPGASFRSAFLEGPDKILIELVEAQAEAAAVPEFVHGEECLFCHRGDVGVAWQKNPHGITVNEKPGTDEFTLGSRNHVRRLKKSGYNKFAIWEPSSESWNETKFADRCAGCHATAVDPATGAWAYYGLDCYTCHGVVDLNHTGRTAPVLLSSKGRDEARVVNSICASCHLRGGKSRSTARPYPNNFIPGGNLFQDLHVDWSLADEETLNPGDRHVWRSARDVALHGSSATCLSCHAVHAASTEKHRRVLSGPVCQDCHWEGKPRKEVKQYTVRSPLCEY